MRASISKPGSRPGRIASATVAVLGFHRLGAPPPGSWETWFSVGEETFVRFLGELRDDGWGVISLDDFLSGLDHPDRLPERAALITFDDGYRFTARAAIRLLGERGLPGVFFVPSDYVGRSNDFERDTDEPEEPICDRDDLRALTAAGISVQSHAASHKAFSTLDLATQVEEAMRSKTTLETAAGAPVEALAYPYGDVGRDPDALAAALAAGGYRAAFGYGGGPVEVEAIDPFRIPRIAIGPDTDLTKELAA